LYRILTINSIEEAGLDQVPNGADKRTLSVSHLYLKAKSKHLTIFKDYESDIVSLQVRQNGKLQVANYIIDYRLRGEELENYSYLEFFVETYEEKQGKAKKQRTTQVNDENDDEEKGEEHTVGRLANLRSNYHEGHPKHDTHSRVVHSKGHNTLPSVVGPFFPRADNPEQRLYYYVSMLAILSPWRNIDELKTDEHTWQEEFEGFVSGASQKTTNALAGIQYHYDCQSASQRLQEMGGNVDSNCTRETENIQWNEEGDDESEDEAVITQQLSLLLQY
jgi:hypothetical protein